MTRHLINAIYQQPSLSRIRAKIQNEYKLFQADDTVKRFRGMLEDDKRVEAIEDKPTGIGQYSVILMKQVMKSSLADITRFSVLLTAERKCGCGPAHYL